MKENYFGETLTMLLKKHFDHDVVYVSHERRADACKDIMLIMLRMITMRHGMIAEKKSYPNWRCDV